MNHAWAVSSGTSLFAKICLGHFDWNSIRDFPEDPSTDGSDFQRLSIQLAELLKTVDPVEVERTGRLPEAYLSQLRNSEFLRLQLGKNEGGPGLSRMSNFKLFCQAYEHSIGAAISMVGSNAFGIGCLLTALPEGPTREYIVKRLREGALSGWADTEPSGASSRASFTTVTMAPDGDSYLVSGEKAFIGNGPNADVLIVSACSFEDGQSVSKLCLIETKSPGFEVIKHHALMGLKGFEVGALRFTNVKVPKDRVFEIEEKFLRDAFLVEPMVAVGRMYSLTGASLTMGRKALEWARYFCSYRKINGRPLAEFDEIKRNLALSASEIFALEAMVEWCLFGTEGDKIIDKWWEFYITKNVSTLSVSAVVDRSLSVLGAFGYERSESSDVIQLKGPAIEQYYRDIRGLRISGAVDFLVEFNSAVRWLYAFYYNPNFDPRGIAKSKKSESLKDRYLNENNNDHLNFIKDSAIDLQKKIAKSVKLYPKFDDLIARERLLILLNQVAKDLTTMGLSLAKASKQSSQGKSDSNDLADIYCAHKRIQVMGHNAQLETELSQSAAQAALFERVSQRVMDNVKK